MTERLKYIDSIKGFAIFLVVMGHVIAWSFRSFDNAMAMEPSPILLWRVIYSFHMPLFMFISGFLFGRGSILTFNEYVKRTWGKFKVLIVPYFVSGTIVYFWRGVRPLTYWYLLTLFQLIVIVGVVNLISNKISRNKGRAIFEALSLTLIVVAINIFPIYYNNECLYVFDWFPHLKEMSPYFCLGYLTFRYINLSKVLKNNVYSICLIVFILSFFINFSIGECVSRYVVAIMAIYCCFYVFVKRFTTGKVIDNLQKIGERTLAIYILHFFFDITIFEAGEYFVQLSQSGKMGFVSCFVLQFLFSCTISTVVIGLSLISKRFINTSRILSALILGDFNQNKYENCSTQSGG